MSSPLIISEQRLTLAGAAEKYLPTQGGIELQRDGAGKIHTWHSHDVHETLVVLSGNMVLEYVRKTAEDSSIESASVTGGDRIELPQNTIHQSTAGSGGCVYFIVPESGRAAHTTQYSDPIRGSADVHT